MSFTKQNSSARRIFRFMGWAGSLVVLIVSIGLPEQGAYQLLPMLPFVLPLFAIWFSRGIEANDEIERRGRKKKNKEVWAAYFTSQVFLPLLAIIYLLANQWFKIWCFSLVNPVNGALLLATFITIVRPKIPSMLGIRQLFSIKKVIVWQLLPLLTPTSYLGINENRTNVTQQIDRSEPKYIVVNNQVELTSKMKDLLKENYRLVEKKYSSFQTLSTLLRKSISCALESFL